MSQFPTGIIIDLSMAEEKSAIAREFRLRAKKEKKKLKSDAKKQRKLNGILNRRMVSLFDYNKDIRAPTYTLNRLATMRNTPRTKTEISNEP